MKAQIDALREAFSADKDKPFQLRASFPYGTPSDSYQPSPPVEAPYSMPQMTDHESYHHHHPPANQSFPLQTMTPPISAVSRDSGFDSPHSQHSRGLAPSSTPSMSQYPSTYSIQASSMPTVDESQWNPTPIFQQWNTAFSIPAAALAPPPPPPSATPTSSSSHQALHFANLPVQSTLPISPASSNPYVTQYPASAGIALVPQPSPQQQRQQQVTTTAASATPNTITPPQINYAGAFVSSKQWQQSVASVFDPGGLKRRWNYGVDAGDHQHQQQQATKRMR
jgi:hypothetical protein